MRSLTRIFVVVSLALAALAPTAVGAATRSSRSLDDEVGDVPRDHADVEFARIRYEHSALTVSMRMVSFTDPLTHPAWVDGYTSAFWFLDAEPGGGDADSDFLIQVGTAVGGGSPRFRGWVYDRAHEGAVCSGPAVANEATRTYRVSFPARCVDRSDRLRFHASFEWDRTPQRSDDESWFIDDVESDECSPYNYTCAYYSKWAERP